MTIYLYVKTHNITGLKYLGKTSSKTPHLYMGSGKYWSRHIKQHGYDVTTKILKECKTNAEIRYWGIYYSELWNIVESDEWANLKIEDGDGGANTLALNDPRVKAKRAATISRPEIKAKIRQAQQIAQSNPVARLKQHLSHIGSKNSRYDPKVYSFIHQTGLVENCTRYDLCQKYNLPHLSGGMSRLIAGSAHTFKGWKIA